MAATHRVRLAHEHQDFVIYKPVFVVSKRKAPVMVRRLSTGEVSKVR